MIGETILHYQILEKLGQGGMGIVYKAEDTKLKRTIALKFLSRDLTRDKKARERFIHEARAASTLDHPNICTIYDINETRDGQLYICMAHYGGKTLRDKIEGGPLSVAETVGIAVQIAQGLARAHEAGIIHRDIKPANIIFTERGEVKIVDFGLAKLTTEKRITKTGSTLGTVDYMSPQQVQGEVVDHRTDIWSLGVVIYELLTGQSPFRYEHDVATIYSIVNEKPKPIADAGTCVPVKLQRIVDKALAKEPGKRYQQIDDLLKDLRWDRQGSSESVKLVNLVSGGQSRKSRIMLAVLTVLALMILLTLLYMVNRPPAKQILATHKQITFTGKAFGPAISPDGKYMAYLHDDPETDKKVMVMDLAGGQPLEVFSAIYVFPRLRWSPDGSELLLQAKLNDSEDLRAFLVPRLGGIYREMASGSCWSSDGSQIAHIGASLKSILFTDKVTGDTRSVTLTGSFTWLLDIDWSPLGNRLLFLTSNQERYTIWTIKPDGSQQQNVLEDSFRLYSPRWSANGKAIYYLRDKGQTRDLMKIKIVSGNGTGEGSPQLLQTGLQAGEFVSLFKDNSRLLYTRELRHSNLWLASLEGKKEAQTIRTRKLTTGTSWIHDPSISPDGNKVAFSIGKRPHANIFVMPLEGGPMQQLTFLNSYNASVSWSPDGKEIAFGSAYDGKPKVWRVNSNGGTPRPFDKSELSNDLTWSPGSDILYQRPGNQNYHILDVETEYERPLVAANDLLDLMFFPRASPDGKSVAVNRYTESEGSGLWLISLDDSLQVLLCEGDVDPIEWSADGKWIYGWNTIKKPVEIIMISSNGDETKTLLTLPFNNIWYLSMTPDAKQIVYTVVEWHSDVWVMENFDPEIR